MFCETWGWIVMKSEEMKRKAIERVKEWRAANPEKKKIHDAKANKKYMEKKRATDPKFMERRRESVRKASAKYRATMTEEEHEEYKRKERERIAAYRARKKAEKLALEAAAKAAEENKGTV